jgi:hypothetical protein
MDLSRAIDKFAKNTVYGWNSTSECFEVSGKKGSFSVYDRFISDRTFGTKKRLLLLPRQDYIPSRYPYIRVGNSLARFMVDSLNEDIYSETPYANTYLLREAKYVVEIGAMQGAARASGSGGKQSFVVDTTTFGDYERYTANNSSELPTVDYTVADIFLPLKTPINSGCLVRVDGKTFEVTEVSRVSNLLWVRAQKIGEDVTPTVAADLLYQCDITLAWDVYDTEVTGTGGVVSLLVDHPCQTSVVRLLPSPQAGTVSVTSGQGFGINYGQQYNGQDIPATLHLYDTNKVLLAKSVDGILTWTGTPASEFLLAVAPAFYEETGAIAITVGF